MKKKLLVLHLTITLLQELKEWIEPYWEEKYGQEKTKKYMFVLDTLIELLKSISLVDISSSKSQKKN